MRKQALILVIVIFAIVVVIAYFARDRYFENAIERAGQAIAQAKVEIDDFHLSLIGLRCSWDRLQVADRRNPWRNILETGRASFVIEGRPLFWKRVIIKEMILEDVRSGTARTTDGSLPAEEQPASESWTKKVSAALERQLKQLPVFDLSALGKKLEVDSLVNVNNLAAVQGYDRLRSFADSSLQHWQTNLQPQTYVTQAQEIRKEIETLQIRKSDDPVALAENLNKVNGIYKKASALQANLRQQESAFNETLRSINVRMDTLRQAVNDDVERAKRLAKLQNLEVKDVGLLLFGDPVVRRAEQLLEYIALGRKYLPTAKAMLVSEKEEARPRPQGRDVWFPFHYRYPRFLVRSARLTGATAGGDTSRAYFLNGSLSGLTNEPAVFGEPTRFNIDFARLDGNHYSVAGSFDHTADEPRDSLWIAASNFNLGTAKLAPRGTFPQAVSAKKGDINLAGFFVGDRLDVGLELLASPVTFHYEQESSGRITKIVREVLAGVRQLELRAAIRGEQSDYALSLSTTVDRALGQQVRNVLSKNLQEAQQQVEQFVRNAVDQRRQEVETLLEKNKETLVAELRNARRLVDQQVQEIERRKKEIEDRIEAEKRKARQLAEDQKKKIEQEAKKKLKGFFKKP